MVSTLLDAFALLLYFGIVMIAIVVLVLLLLPLLVLLFERLELLQVGGAGFENACPFFGVGLSFNLSYAPLITLNKSAVYLFLSG